MTFNLTFPWKYHSFSTFSIEQAQQLCVTWNLNIYYAQLKTHRTRPWLITPCPPHSSCVSDTQILIYPQLGLCVFIAECVVGPGPVGIWVSKPLPVLPTIFGCFLWKVTNPQLISLCKWAGQCARVTWLTCGVKVIKIVGTVLGRERSSWSVFPAQPAVPVTAATRACHDPETQKSHTFKNR